MNQKIVFFDIDGTILDDEKQIPSSTKKAIQKLKQNGIYVAIATGRAPFMFEDLRKELEIESYVSFNGQYVVFEGNVVYNNPLGQDELIKLYKESTENNYPMVFMNEKQMRASVGNHPHIEKSLQSLKYNYPEVDSSFFMDNTIYQALLFCEKGKEKHFVTNHDSFHYIRWHDYSCDVLPGGGSKAVGVEKLIEASGLNITDSYAFGDGLNDLEMIREVGTGIAMGNAVPDLKAVADYTTDSVVDDGILKGLKHIELI
ncbi:hydrolase Cof [Virgibacillus profundi]|uniref:Hydrolase Cof n=1 Tax=Virgibacillus profundi TaxID=2024555 RepID=A0A2A2IES2_9BACI|nr:Cof-type HAD-IIB family hydrolase [Virgibacillus profundi]PAV29858.1 hydrolase Cof [Virgibacillus profundi]PXY54030.1 Cof-type HAD-IIB family hydrolase [Virgibacillus profundi]